MRGVEKFLMKTSTIVSVVKLALGLGTNKVPVDSILVRTPRMVYRECLPSSRTLPEIVGSNVLFPCAYKVDGRSGTTPPGPSMTGPNGKRLAPYASCGLMFASKAFELSRLRRQAKVVLLSMVDAHSGIPRMKERHAPSLSVGYLRGSVAAQPDSRI